MGLPRILLLWTALQSLLTTGGAQGPVYSPLRPPAVPLAVRSPYLNAWVSTAGRKTLNNQTPRFGSPATPLEWEGIVVVDDVAYEYMGNAVDQLHSPANFATSEALSVTFDSQQSNFTFRAGPVIIEASFFSPVIPKDLCRTSMPLSYLTTSVQSVDGRPHRIRFYSDVGSTWAGTNTLDQLSWSHQKSTTQDIHTWSYGLKDRSVFHEVGDLPQWGDVMYSTSPSNASNFSLAVGELSAIRHSFVQNYLLQNHDNVSTSCCTPVFAFAHDFGVVNESVSVRYTIGSVQDPVMQYATPHGMTKLSPWWYSCYRDISSMIDYHWQDYDTVRWLADEFESQLKADVNQFYEGSDEPPVYSNGAPNPHDWPQAGTDQSGHDFVYDSSTGYGFLEPSTWSGVSPPDVSEAQSYYSIVALSARQTMGAFVYARDPNPKAVDPLVFLKEISSDGNVNSVDVLYPASPFFLYANPDLLRYALQPLYQNQEGRLYPNRYCMHDLGTNFPNATGHEHGDDEYMPVEESADFILMSYAYHKFTGAKDWLKSHYALLAQFAQYLVEFGLVPATQTSTDDFAGKLANQTNLAIKAIVGLRAMSAIAQLSGHLTDANNFSTTASTYYDQWESYAMDPSKKHTSLAYGWRSSWGLLYNLYFDKLLNMGLVNETVYEMQSRWYGTVSQAYGVPLDSRSHETKSDWQIWTAATCLTTTRGLIINSIALWLNETVTGGPFTDRYVCIGDGGYPDGSSTGFSARPVVGGHYALLALGKTGQTARNEGGNTTGSLFFKNDHRALPTQAAILKSE